MLASFRTCIQSTTSLLSLIKHSIGRLNGKKQRDRLNRNGRRFALILLLAFSPILPTQHLSRESLIYGDEVGGTGPLNEFIFKQNGFSIFGVRGAILHPYSFIPSLPWWWQEELSIFPKDDDALSSLDLDGSILGSLHNPVNVIDVSNRVKYLQSVLEDQIANPSLAKCLSNQLNYAELAYRDNRDLVILDLIEPSPVPAIWLLRSIKIKMLTNGRHNEYRRYSLMFSKSCKGPYSYLRYPFFQHTRESK